MSSEEWLNEQLKSADDVNELADESKQSQEELSETVSEVIPDTNTKEGINTSNVSFTTNVEISVVEELLQEYTKTHPDLTEGQAITLFTDEAKRSMMFRTMFCVKHKLTQQSKDKLKLLYGSIPTTTNYTEYDRIASDALGIETEDSQSHGFFKVVQEVQAEDEEVEHVVKNVYDSTVIQRFVSRAIREDIPEDLVNRAAAKATADTDTYDKFEKLIDDVLDEDQREEEKSRERDIRLQRAIRSDLQTLWNDPNPVNTLRTAIFNTYNTEAVTVPELCEELRGNPELKLNVYKKEIYSIIHQIKKPFVEEAVHRCLSKWENNAVVDGIIFGYLDSLGVPEEEREDNCDSLMEALPENIKNQLAPDRWKQYKAVEIITQRNLGASADITDEIFQDPDASVEFGARMENYIDDGVPFEAAQRQASEDYCHSLPDDRQISMFGKVGQFAGRAIRFKYEAAADMESLMRESLGEYADQYFEQRDARAARRAELRAYKEEQDMELKRQKIEEKAERKRRAAEEHAEMAEERREQRRADKDARREERRYNNQGGYGNSRYQDSRYGRNTGYNSGGMFGRPTYGSSSYGRSGYGTGGNFAPRIPTTIIAILVNLVIGLLSFIFFGGTKSAFVAVGLAISIFGFIRKQTNEPNSMLMIIGGYALVIIAFIVII